MRSARNLHSVNDVGSPCYVNSAQAAVRFIHVAKLKNKQKTSAEGWQEEKRTDNISAAQNYLKHA